MAHRFKALYRKLYNSSEHGGIHLTRFNGRTNLYLHMCKIFLLKQTNIQERQVWVPSDGHQYLGREQTVTESQSGSQVTMMMMIMMMMMIYRPHFSVQRSKEKDGLEARIFLEQRPPSHSPFTVSFVSVVKLLM